VDRPVAARDRVAGWRASIAGIGMVVVMTVGVVLGGWALSVMMLLLAP
jgi:hypothetical protein